MNNRPLHVIEYENDVALLGLIKRLKEYASNPDNSEMHCDLLIAASIIDYVIRTGDDYK
jgi:hypothetical protein